jgi:hypothetical protein
MNISEAIEKIRITTKNDGLLYRDGVVIHLPEADNVAFAYGFSCAERFVRALERILVAAHTEPQLRLFGDTCGFTQRQIKRIRTVQDVCARNPDRPILLLPAWYESGNDVVEALDVWQHLRKGKIVDIGEAMVLGKIPFDYSLLS